VDNNVIWQADAVALADRVGELVTRIRCAETELGAVLVEIEDRGVGDLFGYRSVTRLLEELADISADAAGKLVRRARALHPSHHLDGTTSPALAPATAAAARDGRLSNPAIDVIIETVKQIPAEHRPEAEREMVTLAQNAGRREVAALGTHLLGYLNPDGPAPDDSAPSVPERELSLRRKRTGVWELNGKFDDETGTRANALLDSLADRRTGDDGPDLRSPQERYGDAFSDAVDLALNSPELPMQAGERTHVLVTVSLETLRNGIGAAGPEIATSTDPATQDNQTSTAATSRVSRTEPSTATPDNQTGADPAPLGSKTGTCGAPLDSKTGTSGALLGSQTATSTARPSDTSETTNAARPDHTHETTNAAHPGHPGKTANPTIHDDTFNSAHPGDTNETINDAHPGHTHKPTSTARLGDSGEISAADARLLACDSSVIPAVLGSKSEPLDLGRLRRLITAGLRRALYLRDRGCAFPGCHRPPRHCQGHHVRHWADGGPTGLGNLVLLCSHHHRLLHRSGWQVRIALDGFPEFIPPVFIDRRRKPRRNNVHRPLPCAA
jgi:hypothetical protein